jgi:molybdopterin synthase catalytic subunit
MDYLKTEAPFWKKRHLTGKGAGGWVEANVQDQAAAQKWRA